MNIKGKTKDNLNSCYDLNKAKPKGSIAEAYIADECLTFYSRYLVGIDTIFNQLRPNDDGFDQNGCNDGLGIFRRSGRPLGRGDGKYGWRQVSRSNPVCKLTSVNSIFRIQRQSSPTSNIGKKRQLFRANSNHAPPTSTDAPSLSSPPLSIIEESRQSLRTNIENDLVGVSNALSLSSPASNVVGKYFRPVSEHERKLASWLGYCARSCGPPKEPWNAIEAQYRTLLWSMIQDYFDVSPESPEKWKKLEEMHKYSSDDERLQHVPEGLTVDTWKEMFKVFANEDFQEEMQRIEKQPTNDNETGPTPMMS
ncbi:hypothetical protein GH714_024962 [Hevea brasiliensis]|uniref:DUF4218 domain-containing protein n=1 Tax=Hevea brasiliensis TaxID=3981 RepID=A0A6A6LGG2_HEVBR|nr:hypothetical protein GH714_024962 [Hevea brasiliensis]